jgi:hypothetical protein
MLSTLLKLITMYFINQRVEQSKQHVSVFAKNAADYAESRARFIKSDLMVDLDRMTNSFVGFLIMFAGIIFSGMMALLWIFAIAWNSDYRVLILAFIITTPLILSAIIFYAIRNMWKNSPLLNASTELIARDWQAIRKGLESKESLDG